MIDCIKLLNGPMEPSLDFIMLTCNGTKNLCGRMIEARPSWYRFKSVLRANPIREGLTLCLYAAR